MIEALGNTLPKRFELREATLDDNPDMNGASLENLSSNYLGLRIRKSHRDDDFSAHLLSAPYQRYSSLDELVSRKLGEILKLKYWNLDNDVSTILHL